MKNLSFLCSLLLSFSLFAGWDQPEVLCPEEILPQGFSCPDFSEVKDVFADYPKELSSQDIWVWKNERSKDLKLCRYKEALRRESKSPGTLSSIQKQIAWMIVEGGKDTEVKLEAIMSASKKYSMPPQILLGALTQESLLANLGISPDGGNYSCGISQLNIQEWCEGLSQLSSSDRLKLHWPAIDCRSLPSTIISPFYEIAQKNLGSRPPYMIDRKDFAGISYDMVAPALKGTIDTKQTIYQAVNSFLQNCQNPAYAIPIKAHALNKLFTNFVPAQLRWQNRYPKDESFKKVCRHKYESPYYPLHTGWLLAVASYNAGPRQVQLVEHYFGVKENQFPHLQPTDLIEALYWGGKVKEANKKVYYVGQNGRLLSQPFYKSCVVQRHVARVIEHVTRPGKILARSLEQTPCSPKVIPEDRLNSSGKRHL